jgi:adhesin transport system membrane fusion protein
LSAFFTIALLWASLSVIDETTVGDGRVIPASQVKIIQILDSGILSKMYVEEGEHVKKGQILLQIDDTRFVASYQERKKKYFSLLSTVSRLKAEAANLDHINFPKELFSEKQTMAHEIALFESRKKGLNDSLENLQRSKDYAEREMLISEPLFKKGIISEIELLRTKRQLNEINGNISDKKDKFRMEVGDELAKSEAELAMITEGIASDNDRVKKSTVLSPVSGTIKKLNVTTIGAVIQSGAEIAEIVPDEDFLLVEAHIKPKDIGFIQVGQKALVKFSAYDFSIYGGLNGKVTYISADTLLSDDKKETYYKIEVRTDKNHLGSDEKPLFLKVGMQATVDTLTGKKSVLSYLLKPLIKAKQNALRER